MALDINGYNATFKAFTDFAKVMTEGKGGMNSIARVETGVDITTGALAGRTITAAQGDSLRHIFKWTRSEENQAANNITRDLFKNAIIDMFGGEKNIPKSVMKAMLMSDYGKGKPLTARRIMAVKNAIDATGIMKQKGVEETMLPKALDKGYTKGEMPKLAKAANLLAQANGCSVEQAFEEVSTPGSKANRLMNYGGRFMQSADNFKNGLRLIDSFNSWFDETGAALMKVHPTPLESHFEEGMSKTLLNGNETMFTEEYKLPSERFVFEEIANNPAVNLAEKDANKLFSLENNQAFGSIARSMLNGRTQTVAQIPPEKRTTFFKAMNMIRPLVSTAEEANVPPSQRHTIKVRLLDAPAARFLKNLDQLIALDSQKKLTAANLVKLCFPEIKEPSANPVSDVVDLVNKWDNDISVGSDVYPDEDIAGMNEAMKSTGCSVEEAAQIAKGELQLPNVPYFSSGTLGLEHGSVAARNQLIGDLDRGIGYNYTGGEPLLKTAGFRFNLPGGESLFANKTPEFKDNIPVIADKLEALCGPAHKAQATSLLMMTCQAGLGPLLGGLRPYGVESTEHSSVDFTITKNNDSGDISIRYSSPKELPFAFEWTATIKPDGYVSTTPIRFTDETALATLKRETTEAADKLKESTLALYREKPDYDPTQDAKIAKEIGKSVDAIFSGVGADRGMLTLLQTNKMAAGVLLNADRRIRSPEKVAKTVAGLKENLDELRAASNGNQRIFDVGLKHIANFGGKALKSGLLTKMCEMIAKEDLGAFRNLSASSSPEKIIDTMCRLDRLAAKIFDETEILKTIGEVGQSETITAKGLVMGLVFAHCGEDAVNGLKSALESPNAKRLDSVLMDMGNGKFPRGASVEPQTRIAISNYADMFNMSYRYEMYGALNDALGIDNANVDMLEARDDKKPVSPKSEKAILDTMKEYTLVMEERRISRPNLADLPPQGA